MSKVSTRINREIINLQKNNDAFLISFDESNLRKIDAIINDEIKHFKISFLSKRSLVNSLILISRSIKESK